MRSELNPGRPDVVIGKTLGNYHITERIGAGGMGVVYAAKHALIGRKAAVKVLLPKFSDNKEIIQRFFGEARAAAVIDHPGIVDVLDFGYAEDGSAYIIMEYLDGMSLSDRIRQHVRLSEPEAIRIARQVASALAAAHHAGIVHRDLKPDNVFLVPDADAVGGERVKVLDFGIAKLSDDVSGSLLKTRTGMVMGSPLYMSPEQCRGAGTADNRSDIYCLGCVLFHMVSGRPPFPGIGGGEIIAMHIYEQPPSPRTLVPALSTGLERIILRMLEKDPDERFATMGELVRALDEVSGSRFRSPTSIVGYGSSPGTDIPAARPVSLSGTGESRPVRTTLHVAASQVSIPPTRSKRGLVAGLLAGVVVLGVVGLLIGSMMRDTEPDVASAVAPLADAGATRGASASASADAAVEVAAEVPDAAGVREPDTPPPPATPDKVKLVIRSIPRGALVRDENRRLLGETPYTHEAVKGDAPIAFIVERIGFEDETLSLVPDRNRTSKLRLRRVHRSRPGGTKPGGTKRPGGTKPGDVTKPGGGDGFGTTVDPLAP